MKKRNLVLALMLAFGASVAVVQAVGIYGVYHVPQGNPSKAKWIYVGDCESVGDHYYNHDFDNVSEDAYWECID